MPISGDTPFLYRFRSTKAADGTLKVYGPRPFEQVVQYYATEQECQTRPADGPDSDWRPVSAWLEHYEPPRATERQAKRLAKLGVDHGPDISEEEARFLIREAEELLAPTKGLREKAESVAVTISDADTRGSLKAKIEEVQRLEEVARLRRLGAKVGEDASWEELSEWERRLEIETELKRKGLSFTPGTSLDELEDAEYVMEDLREAVSHARPAGVRYTINKGIDISEARSHAEALGIIGDVFERLEHECDGRRGNPKKTELKEALEVLFQRLTSGIVSQDQAEEWVNDRIGLGHANAGCLSLLALLIPLGLGGGALFSFFS